MADRIAQSACNARRAASPPVQRARSFAERPICPYCDGPLVRRTDDDEAVLRHRLEEFNAKTQPLAAFYEKLGRCAGLMAIADRDDGLRRHLAFDRTDGMIPIKSGKEIEKMRQACRTASEILERLSELVRPGISTKEVDEAAADLMQEAGVKSAFLGYRLGHRVFPGNICISLNDEIVHGIGSQRRIQYGDIVKLDIGVIEDGWVGDTASTVAVGMIDERTEKLLRVTEKRVAAGDRVRVRRGAARRCLRRGRGRSGRATASASCANLSVTAWAESCTKSRRCRTTASAGAVRA